MQTTDRTRGRLNSCQTDLRPRSSQRVTTAGVVVIGNEVLSGKVEEQNARYFIHELRTLGVALQRVVFVRDEPEVIARDVREMADALDVVFTTGGVGSTHDDVTFTAIGMAFQAPLEEHPTLIRRLEAYHGERMTPQIRQMARLPRGAELEAEDALKFPLIRMRNVYILPGVPSLVRSKFEVLRDRLRADRLFVLRELRLSVRETQIADMLAEEDARHPDVEIGSYPQFESDALRTKLTFEGRDAEAVDGAVQAVVARLDPAWLIPKIESEPD